jgi:hypothetical protein
VSVRLRSISAACSALAFSASRRFCSSAYFFLSSTILKLIIIVKTFIEQKLKLLKITALTQLLFFLLFFSLLLFWFQVQLKHGVQLNSTYQYRLILIRVSCQLLTVSNIATFQIFSLYRDVTKVEYLQLSCYSIAICLLTILPWLNLRSTSASCLY